jgi:hypothetical protein
MKYPSPKMIKGTKNKAATPSEIRKVESHFSFFGRRFIAFK